MKQKLNSGAADDVFEQIFFCIKQATNSRKQLQ